MTPTASRLKARLDERRRWFINEWFFKWHFIGKDGPVTIESFDGRDIQYGGIGFSGTPRLVYWDTIVRGVRKEIDEQLVWIDEEVRKYNRATALQSIDECAGELISFVNSIRRYAVQKDRILRGDGIRFPPEEDAGYWHGTSEREIVAQAEALKAAIPDEGTHTLHGAKPLPVTFRERASEYWDDNRWWLGPLGLVIGAAGLVAGLIA